MRKTLRIAAALVTAATVALCFCIPSAARAAGEEVELLFAGDVMMHQTQLDNHRNGNAYDFKADYDYIRAIVSKADIALANFEMTMSGKTPYKGYPRFNAPDAITDALAYAGFDVMATANNHIRDTKDDGFFRTTQLLRDKGFTVIGTKADESQKTYAVIEKNGIKIGFGNFTSHVNAGLSEATKGLINVFSCSRFEPAMLKVKAEIDAMRADGAEFIVMVMHWGAEYQLKNNAWEQKIARRLADYGADLVIGGHPHVVQNVSEYDSPVSGKKALIYYSLGNLVSNMGYGYRIGHGYTETGILALVKIKRGEDGKVSIADAGYLTTYCSKYKNKVSYLDSRGKTRYRTIKAYDILPALDALSRPGNYRSISKTTLKHLTVAAANSRKVVGKSAAKLMLFKVTEYQSYPWQ